jgi:hypothetical protein
MNLRENGGERLEIVTLLHSDFSPLVPSGAE